MPVFRTYLPIWLSFFGLIFFGLPASAQSLSDYLSVPFPSELTRNTAGTALAWVFNNQGERTVYMAEAPFFNGQKLTSFPGDNGVEISALTFSPDDHFLVFTRGNTVNASGEPANPGQLQESTARVLYAYHTVKKTLRRIAPGASPCISPDSKYLAYIASGHVWLATLSDSTAAPTRLFQSRGIPGQLAWSPDGSKLAFQSRRENHSFIGVYDRLSKSVSFPDPSADEDAYPTWSPDGKKLAFIRVAPRSFDLPFTPKPNTYPWQIRVIDFSTGQTKEWWRADSGKGSAFNSELPASSNKLLWPTPNILLFPWEKTGWLHIYSLDLQKNTVRDLSPGNGEVENWHLSVDQQSLYYVSNHGDPERRHIWKTTLNGSMPQCLSPGKDIEWNPVELKTGLAFLYSSATRPAWPALLQNGQRSALMPDLFPTRFPTRLSTPQSVSITGTDGALSFGQLFLPPNQPAEGKYPAVIFLHGGSRRQMLVGFHYGQYYSHAYALNQFFASRGYAVLALNYRSGIGYGLDFREAPDYGAAGASEVRDLIGAAQWLSSRPDVDPSRISLWGGSYGGYLTAHGLAQRPELFLCGVDIHGVHDWNDEIPTFAPWYNPLNHPEAARKAYESSPEYYAHGWQDPVLFIHGDDDRNVPFGETIRMLEILRQQQVPCEQLVFPDEVHSLLLHQNWLKAYQATFDFIDKYTHRTH